jgi:hypothetical protein
MLFRIPYIGYVKVIPYRIISWIAGLFW